MTLCLMVYIKFIHDLFPWAVLKCIAEVNNELLVHLRAFVITFNNIFHKVQEFLSYVLHFELYIENVPYQKTLRKKKYL